MASENKMGVMPVNKLILSMSIPMMLSMLIQALYNVVDSMFVAQISENALTAVSLAFPAQNLMIAVEFAFFYMITASCASTICCKCYVFFHRMVVAPLLKIK